MQHERGLAGAVRPEQGDALTLVHMEVHAEQRLVAVRIGIGQAADVQDGRAHSATARAIVARASPGSVPACAHCAGVAVTLWVTGIRPPYPRESIARWMRSPRS